jgi:hypothetical protein
METKSMVTYFTFLIKYGKFVGKQWQTEYNLNSFSLSTAVARREVCVSVSALQTKV